MEPLVPTGVFQPANRYFDTPTYGLAPTASYEALIEAADRWRAGTATMAEYDGAVGRSRELFAMIAGTDPSHVAIGANVSGLVGPVAASIPDGSRVVVPEGEFTSLLFPLLVGDRLHIRTVPVTDLAGAVDPSTDVVAFSLVQSSNGEVADLGGVAETARRHGARILVDATHAVGWLPFDPGLADVTFVAAYKWLMCPRGVAFMVTDPGTGTVPLNAGWYAGEEPWQSIYGEPLRLAADARRYDTSPAWLAWMGAVPSLELVADLGVRRINAHDVGLANLARTALGLPESTSAIVTIPASDPSRLEAAGIKAAVRASAVRIGCHVHNSSADVEALVSALTGDG